MDFTVNKYTCLLKSLKHAEYKFQTFSEFLTNPNSGKVVVLRHDVDLLPSHSLRIAQIECELGIKGSYYFRAVPESWNEEIIKQIATFGHEIGYHYESLTTCHGNIDIAYKDFADNLIKLRTLVSVSTICMHGSPRSPYDSKDIWKQYSYRKLNILGEPYLDIDFSEMFYLTDTGRRWDGFRVSVRDKIGKWQDKWIKQGMVYHNTDDVIHAVVRKTLPKRIMITIHPQRWNNFGLSWCMEFILQNIKNIVKRIIVKNND